MEQPPREPKLLLVDDQPHNLMALRAALEPLKLTVATAHSGAEALRHLLTDDDFAAIILDVQMPTMDGFETAHLIKQREKSRYLPILFITAATDDEKFVQLAYGSGAVDFLHKPFNTEILRSKVSVFVDLFRQREAISRQAALLRESEQREALARQELREKALEQEHALQLQALARQQRNFVRDVLYSLSEGRLTLCDSAADLPAELPLYAPAVALSKPTLRMLRHQVTEFAGAAGWQIERTQDFETAVGEAAMNAVVHGVDASGEVRVDRQAGFVQVWVRDRGAGISEDSLHRATLEKGYTTAGTLGHGFWIMLKTADRIFLLTGSRGTTVVLEQGRSAPQPAWLKID